MSARQFVLHAFLVAAIVATAMWALLQDGPLTQAGEVHSESRILGHFGKLPLYFIENQGQSDARVAYYLQGRDTSVYFTSDAVLFALSAPNMPEREPESPFEPVSFETELALPGR